MNNIDDAYQRFSKIIEWNDEPFDWIFESYINYLVNKFNSYANFNGENARELKLLSNQFSKSELNTFLSYPFVADLLHPRTRFKSDNDIWQLQTYTLSYLSWIEKLPKEYEIYKKPDGFRDYNISYPVENRIKNHLPVSFTTTMDFPGMDRGGNDLFILSKELIEIERNRLLKAETLIKKWVFPTWKFVSIGTELLVIRGESSEPHRFSSSSFRGLAGLNMLINSFSNSLPLIIDAIVHEAIHSLLYQLEPPYGDFFPDKSNSRNPIKSPWTGNIITLDNIAQASFVWYGLFHFWDKASKYNLIDKEAGDAKKDLEKIITGFSNLDLSLLYKNINTDMFEAISYMKNRLAN